MPPEQRVVFAFFAQPVVAGLVAFCLFPLLNFTGRWAYGGRPADSFQAAVAVGMGTGLAAIFVVAFAAVPAYLWLQKRGRVTRKPAIVGGAVLANLPGALIVGGLAVASVLRGEWPAVAHLTDAVLGSARALTFAALVGMASAAVFCWMAGIAPLTSWRGWGPPDPHRL